MRIEKSQAWMFLVRAPQEMRSTPVAATAARLCGPIPPEASSSTSLPRRSAHLLNRGGKLIQGEVVQHYPACAGVQRFHQFVHALHFHGNG